MKIEQITFAPSDVGTKSPRPAVVSVITARNRRNVERSVKADETEGIYFVSLTRKIEAIKFSPSFLKAKNVESTDNIDAKVHRNIPRWAFKLSRGTGDSKELSLTSLAHGA